MAKKAVVFVHGFMGSPKQFEHLVPTAESASYDTYSLTLPGHGISLTEFRRFGANDWQAALNSLLDEIHESYDSIFIVSHSMGGLLAINAYLADPRKISSIFALALPLYLKLTPNAIRTRFLAIARPRVGEDIRITSAREMCGVSGLNAINSILLAPNCIRFLLLMRKTRKLLNSCSIPLTVINSSSDEIVSMKSLRFVNDNATLISLAESTHFWYSPSDKRIIKNELDKHLRGT